MEQNIRKYFFIGMGVIVLAALALIGYGTYLNYTSESQIALRLAQKELDVVGTRAKVRTLTPSIAAERASLTSENMADAVALIDGKITRVYHRQHDIVQAGEPLLAIVNEELPMKLSQADGDILKAQAALEQAESSAARYERLFARNATSREKLEEARTAYAQAQAALAQAEAQKGQLEVMSGYQEITSPLSGELMMLYRSPGSFVTTGTAVALVGDFSRLRFTMDIDDAGSAASFFRTAGTDLSFAITAGELKKVFGTGYGTVSEGAAENFSARVVEVAPDFSESARLRRVTIEVDNKSHLLEPHVYRDARLFAMSEKTALTVPVDAFTGRDRSRIFVVNADGAVELREVTVGAEDGKYIEILSGLSEGEIVLTSDKEGIEAGMKVDVTLEEEHG